MEGVEFCNFVRVKLIQVLWFFLYLLVHFFSNLFRSDTPYTCKGLKQGSDTLSIVCINDSLWIYYSNLLTCQASKCSCICKSPNFKVVRNSSNCNNLCDQSSLADGECGGQGYVSLYENCKYFKILLILPFCCITTNTLTIKCFAFKLIMAYVSLKIYYAFFL